MHDTSTQPTLISWGLGADSTAIISAFLDDPTAYGLAPDLSSATVIVAVTGEEWPDTIDLAEHHILPLLRHHRVRLVQVARGGPRDADGIVVLSDTRSPERLYRKGPWTLSDELTTTGTLPQYASKRRWCSIKFKGWVIDQWTSTEYTHRPYRHVIGFEANELSRAKRDQTYTSTARQPWYPLIDWGYDRARILADLHTRYGVTWPKSYCTMCPYPVSRASLEAHLDRCRAFPELAAAVLLLEHTAITFNPRSTLYAEGSLLSLMRADESTEALEAFNRSLQATPWAVYEVRRIFFAGRTDHCRTLHGDRCAKPGPWCRDTARKGPAWRSVRTVLQGTFAAALEHLREAGTASGKPITTVDGIARVTFRERGPQFPCAERYLVAAPANVPDKQRDNFEAAWEKTTTQNSLDSLL